MQIDRETSDFSSNETLIEQVLGQSTSSNSICIRLDFEENWKANIVYNTLIVDKLPKRSQSKLELLLDGNCLVINIFSSDQKSLMKSANNVFDMCQLSKNCIETVSTYKIESINHSTKKDKRKTNAKKKDELSS